MGAWKRVAAAGRSVSGLGRAHMVAGVRGPGRNRAAKVFVRCFCKASLDCGRERRRVGAETHRKRKRKTRTT